MAAPLGERPLTARNVIASTLLGVRPPELAGRVLVRSGELFGIAEGTTRVALSRMVAAGELEADGGRYRLTGRLLARQARQAESRTGATGPWDGTWRLAVVTADRRPAADRADLRAAMAGLRLAERREGVWLRPDNLDPARLPGARAVADRQCAWFRAEPDDDPAALAAALWDLDGWAGGATALLGRMAARVGDLERGGTAALAPGFVLSAAVLRHLQADPLLPADLLPAGWPGDELRRAYDRYDAAFAAAWRDWFRGQP
ncbi:MAG TPA: PaaX family transcriptional regulator C-terminal domain-containing protein [Acidimicrobiales bacterium]